MNRSATKLGVFLDGAAMPVEEARALWARFSAYMDAHRGDLAGFARAEGFASVHPEARAGQAVLVVSRRDPQKPYGERRGSGGGSTNNQPSRQDDVPPSPKPGGGGGKGRR